VEDIQMNTLKCVTLRFFLLGLILCCSNSIAQQDPWPSKQIKLVVCCAGIVDATARILAENISQSIKQPVIIEAKIGTSGMIAADYVAKAKPDGYTFLVSTNSTHAANQSLYNKIPYDYINDFIPISGVNKGVMALVVNPNLPVKNVRDLTALAKVKSGQLTFGWASSSSRVAMELYKQISDIDVTNIPYKTLPQATIDVAGGQVDMMFSDMVTAAPLVKAGKLRALAVAGKKRVPALPDVPSMEEAGVQGYEVTWWTAVWAPAGTPKDIVKKMNSLIATAISAPKTQEFFLTAGLEPFASSSEELMAFQIAEHNKWRRIIKGAGIVPE